MIAIRLAKQDWGKAWRAMIEGGPVRLVADDPIYEVLPVHLEILSAEDSPTRYSSLDQTESKSVVMPRPIRNFEIYLPLEDNDGRPFAEASFVTLQRELLERFEGVTSNQREYPLSGLWRSGERVFQDRVVVLSVMDFHTKTKGTLVKYLERLKTRLKKEFDQLDILITLQELLAI